MSSSCQKIYNILENILEIKVGENTDISMQNCDKWTSLAHVDIIMSIEEEFGIYFKLDDLPNLTSQKNIIAKVEELLNDK